MLDGRRVRYVKGAPEIVRSLCAKAVGDESVETLNERLLGYQRQAMRTLGFAYQVLEGDEQAIDDERGVVAKDLTYLGTVAIADPVRPDVPEAVGECLSAGIDVKIVTGDTSATAAEIGRQIGLWGEHHDDRAIITGPEPSVPQVTLLRLSRQGQPPSTKTPPLSTERGGVFRWGHLVLCKKWQGSEERWEAAL